MDGAYVLQLVLPFDVYLDAPNILLTQDLNGNGVPEFLVRVETSSQGGEAFQLFEWDGTQFASLFDPNSRFAFGGGTVRGLIQPEVLVGDESADGLPDILFDGRIPGWSFYHDGLPWRDESHIYTWNGQHYILFRRIFSPPVYRFQALQDADRAASFGEFETASELYLEVINSESLDWWSPDRKAYLQDLWYYELEPTGPTPTPPANFAPDPNEVLVQRAYAYLRLVVLSALDGSIAIPEELIADMEVEIPDRGPPGAFKELVRTFWLEFSSSGNVTAGCARVVESAGDLPNEMDLYLGDFYWHGNQSLTYEPADLCPF
jgi:hypothetical protein